MCSCRNRHYRYLCCVPSVVVVVHGVVALALVNIVVVAAELDDRRTVPSSPFHPQQPIPWKNCSVAAAVHVVVNIAAAAAADVDAAVLVQHIHAVAVAFVVTDMHGTTKMVVYHVMVAVAYCVRVQ